MTALPEPRSREAHEHVKQLRDELHRIRAEHGPCGRSLDAYVRYMRDASLLGLNPTSLPERSPIEEDRFFARVVQGPDGHRYWLLAQKRFLCNDGRTRHPRRWWWEHEHGITLADLNDITPACGDPDCIFPAHCVAGRAVARQIYSDQHMLGGLQVEAMRLGHTPSEGEWRRSGRKPSPANYRLRFGSWNNAIATAGLKVRPHGVHVE